MLNAHCAAREQALLAISKIPANSGHSLHKGTPREAFIREFLVDHLSETVAFGTGEIIDARSQPCEKRNQIDIVVYKRDYPRLSFGGGVNGYFVESLVSAIEVKSTLTKADLREAVRAANRIKNLERHLNVCMRSGGEPPGPICLVVAYDGPSQMTTVYSWLREIHGELNISIPELPASGNDRVAVLNPSVDAIFILGKGFLYFDNIPIGFMNDEMRQNRPKARWFMANVQTGSLLVLFLILTTAVSHVAGSWMNPIPYLSGFRIEPARFKLGD